MAYHIISRQKAVAVLQKHGFPFSSLYLAKSNVKGILLKTGAKISQDLDGSYVVWSEDKRDVLQTLSKGKEVRA